MFKELDEISGDQIEVAQSMLDLRRYIHKDYQTFLRVYGIEEIDEERKEVLGKELAFAVHQIAQVIRDPQRVGIVFGRFPYFAVPVGVGVEVYIADMEHERALASADDKRIYVDAFRMFDRELLGDRTPSIIILEELVHAWMITREEAITEHIVAYLNRYRYILNARKLTDTAIEEYETRE